MRDVFLKMFHCPVLLAKHEFYLVRWLKSIFSFDWIIWFFYYQFLLHTLAFISTFSFIWYRLVQWLIWCVFYI